MQRSLFCIGLSVCSALSSSFTVAAANDWPAFRGGSATGVCENCSPPIEWSKTAGIAWETAIPGRGCSSPIVQGNDIFVSTVYPGELGAAVATLVRNGVPIVCAALAAFGILSICGALRAPTIGPSVYGRATLLMIVLSVLIFLSLFGHDLFNEARSSHYRWLRSCLIVLTSLLVLDFTRLKNTSANRSLGLCLVVFGAAVFAFEPGMASMLHGLTRLFSNIPVCMVLTFSAGIMILGLLMYFGAVDLRIIGNGGAQMESAKQSTTRYRFLLVGILALTLLVASAFAVTSAVASIPFLRERIGNTRLQFEAGPWAGWLLLIAAFAGLTIALAFTNWLQPAPLFRSVRFLAVILGFAIFFANNVVLTHSEGVRAIVCVEADTGKIKWVCGGLFSPIEETNERFTSQANPTCVADASKVIAYFGSAGIMCAERDGRLLWTSREVNNVDVYGASASPLLVDNAFIVCSNQDNNFTIQALDTNTGKTIWKKQIAGSPASPEYNRRTPVVIDDGNSSPVVTVLGPYDFRGFDPKNGEQVWSYPLKPRKADTFQVAGIAMNSKTVLATGLGAIYGIERASLGEEKLPQRWLCKRESRIVPLR